MKSPYRDKEIPAQRPEPARELVYVGRDAERKLDPYRVYVRFGLVAVAITFAGFLIGIPAQLAGLIGGLAVLAGMIAAVLRWRKGASMPGQLLRVENGELLIFPNGKGYGLPQRLMLKNIRNVELETKSIEKSQIEVNTVGMVGLGHVQAVDNSRIVFALRKKQTHVLTEAFVSHSDCIEWLGKIRKLLRSHGWLPEAERGA
jgi:hypothetical protein